MEQRYSSDEVVSIIRCALEARVDKCISHQDLIETGKEFGLVAGDIDHAITTSRKQLRAEKRIARRKVGFSYHLSSYLAINCLLFIVNLFTPGPWWFQWSVMGWGIGVFFHYRAVHRISGLRGATHLPETMPGSVSPQRVSKI